MPLLFKEAFCSYARCTPGSYKREMLFRCLHSNAMPFARIINWLEPASMFHFLQELGETTNKDDFSDILHEYQYSLKLRGGFLANRLNMRLAVHLLAKLYDEVRQHENATQRGS
jgi:hypothetical protein